MALTDVELRKLRPVTRVIKLSDGEGLFLLLRPNRSPGWRLKYRFDGREKQLAFGSYPEVSLKLARERRAAARAQLVAGIDPGQERRVQVAARQDVFEPIAREWLGTQARSLDPRTVKKRTERFEAFVFPYLGKKPITTIRAVDVLELLKRIEARGKMETTHRVRSDVSNVFRYAIASSRAERDPTVDLRGAIAAVVRQHRPAVVDPRRIGELMRAIDGYRGDISTEFALRLLPLVFVRPYELRYAEWREFDLEAAEWRIPAARMKMKEMHVVPLCTQAVALLKDLRLVTGDGALLFPSVRSASRPISDNTINAALRRMGFPGTEMCAHGFRTMASTRLNEQGWNKDLIELQLAHAERDESRGAYNRAQRIAERRLMMQSWANYLDTLRSTHDARITTLVA